MISCCRLCPSARVNLIGRLGHNGSDSPQLDLIGHQGRCRHGNDPTPHLTRSERAPSTRPPYCQAPPTATRHRMKQRPTTDGSCCCRGRRRRGNGHRRRCGSSRPGNATPRHTDVRPPSECLHFAQILGKSLRIANKVELDAGHGLPGDPIFDPEDEERDEDFDRAWTRGDDTLRDAATSVCKVVERVQ